VAQHLLLKTLPYLDSVPGLQIARVGLFDRVLLGESEPGAAVAP